MSASSFLNIVGACIGFFSAAFFAVGTLRLTTTDISDLATTYWDFNKHLGDSIAAQRADYTVGALLLLISFSSQLAASLVPSELQPSLLQPAGCAAATIVALAALFLLCSVLLRWMLARLAKLAVRKELEARLQQSELRAALRLKDVHTSQNST
ncbi:MAG: hypothetical protein IV108_10775 [Burkholderiales bacterium]|nr:hypothetical protein [Burkholderiales bacterium]